MELAIYHVVFLDPDCRIANRRSPNKLDRVDRSEKNEVEMPETKQTRGVQ